MSGCKATADSTTPAPTSPDIAVAAPEALAQWVQDTPAGALCESRVAGGERFAVALSGGADSTALLVAACRRWGQDKLVAVHVNHGLQSAASGFEQHCRALCARLDVPLVVRSVEIHRAPGESIEALARQARYTALADAIRGDGSLRTGPVCGIGLGHQADDQVETVLLALLRGAGLLGMAGMAPDFTRDGAWFVRPLLACSAAQLRRWLSAEGVSWIDDPTNADPVRTRNRLRHEVIPALSQVTPAWRRTIARSAAHAAQAADLLRDLAVLDLAQVGDPPQIGALQALSRPRQGNTLRSWLASVSVDATPSEAQLHELVRQINACRTRGHQIEVRCGGGRIAREGASLRWYTTN